MATQLLGSNVVAWYNFESYVSSSGVSDIAQGGNHTAFANPAATPATITTDASGKFTNHVSMDGRQDYFNIKNTSDMRDGTTVTWDAWIRPSGVAASGVLIYQGDGDQSHAYCIAMGHENAWTAASGVTLRVYDSTGTTYEHADSSGVVLNSDEWNHIGVTFSAGTVQFYLNGNSENSYTLATTSIRNDSTNEILIGAEGKSSTEHLFGGDITQMRFWSVALTEAEILELYQASFQNRLSRNIGGKDVPGRFSGSTGITMRQKETRRRRQAMRADFGQ